MSLFTFPVNDGSADRTYDFVGQQPSEGSTTVGKYLEATTDTMENDQIVVKHAPSKVRRRDLVQKVCYYELADGSFEPCVINITMQTHNEMPDAFVEKELLIATALARQAGYTGKARKGYLS